MRKCLLLALGVILISAPVFGQGSANGQYAPSSVRAFAQNAKAEGRSSITVTFPGGEAQDAGTLRDNWPIYSLLEVKVEPGEVRATVGQYAILTWYRARVISVLSRQKEVSPLFQTMETKNPFAGTLAANEMALQLTGGGTALIDGVAVTISAEGEPTSLTFGRTYLMLVSLYQDGGSCGVLRPGLSSIFTVESDGRLTPHVRGRAAAEEVASVGNLQGLRAYLKSAAVRGAK